MSGSLQQSAIDAAINKWKRRLTACVTVCMQINNILKTYFDLLIRPEKNRGQIMCNDLVYS